MKADTERWMEQEAVRSYAMQISAIDDPAVLRAEYDKLAAFERTDVAVFEIIRNRLREIEQR